MKEIIPNFWLPKNRYYELKYHCLQYEYWNKIISSARTISDEESVNYHRSLVNRYHLEKSILSVNCSFHDILTDCVTHGLSYKKLQEKYGSDMPDKTTFYDAYRAFFYFLDKAKGI